MVSRVYVEKKPGFDGEARALAAELRDIVGISGLTGVRLVNRYDVEGATDELFAACVPTVFSEPQSDTATFELPEANGAAVFAVEFLPGQFDQRADSASECIQLISQGERPDVRSAVVYYLEGNLTDADVEAVKRYVINPVEAREASRSLATPGHGLRAPGRRGGHPRASPPFPMTSWPASSTSAAWPWIWPTSSSAAPTSLKRARSFHH
ncbi:MAG: hypothetical protein ACLUW6_06925 [Coriobacteriaceae bacterium]